MEVASPPSPPAQGKIPRLPTWAVALGAAHLLLTPVTRELVGVGPADRYFLPTLGATDALAGWLSLVLLWGGLSAALTWAQRLRSSAARHALALAGLFALLIHVGTLGGLVLSERRYTGSWLPLWQGVAPWGPAMVLAGAAAAAALAWRVRRPLLTGARVVLGVLAGFGVWTGGLLIVAALGAAQPAAGAGSVGQGAPPASAGPPAARVVWLLFDELDHRAAFETHLNALPNLRALRDRGVLATQALQAGDHTLDTVPDMFTGRRLTAATPAGPASLRVTQAAGDAVAWHRLPTWLSATHAAGKRVGVAAWYHPYCRIFGALTATCVWRTAGVAHTRAGVSLGARVAEHLATLDLLRPRRAAIATNVALLREGRRQALDPTLDAVFVHVALPHEPFVWDVAAQQPRVWAPWREGYLANLRWVDHWLGRLQADLARSPLAARTTLIISADHGWRSAAALAGRSPDRRVALLVVPPAAGGGAPAGPGLEVSRPLSARVVGPLVQALALGQLAPTRSAVAQWLRSRAKAAP